MKQFSMHIVLVIAALFMANIAKAEPPNWFIIPDKSTLTFTAMQNNAPVTGSFKTFDGTIKFDPKNMDGNRVNIEIDTNSIKTSYSEMTDTLKAMDWFNIQVFPTAAFVADDFGDTPDGKYEAKGHLTIRDKTVPIILIFTLEEDGPYTIAKGSTLLNRNDFGVGQGNWASTDDIKDEVLVEFVLVTEGQHM